MMTFSTKIKALSRADDSSYTRCMHCTSMHLMRLSAASFGGHNEVMLAMSSGQLQVPLNASILRMLQLNNNCTSQLLHTSYTYLITLKLLSRGH